jgi:hypothetical protein
MGLLAEAPEPVAEKIRKKPKKSSLGFSAASACATMKLTTTTVKVCSTELNDSRSKESVTDVCREALPESTTEVRTGQPQ